MSDTGKTVVFVVVAAVLCGAGYLTRPTQRPLEYFGDQGEPFYPEFTDPLAAAALEVIDFDEKSGAAKPFKVEVKDGVWSIPSHHTYPADGKDRLARTAAGVIDLKKNVKQSDRAQDHEALGVIDPLDDTTPTLKGRGQRVKLLDAAGGVLADFVFGKPVEGKEGFRYVRVPGKNRTYAVKVDVDISTRFADWIETNLLELISSDITQLEINDYTIDEATGMVNMADHVYLNKGTGNKWSMEGLPAGKQLDESKVNQMASALSRIRITGVRPKPESLSHDLMMKTGLTLDPFSQLALQAKGFFVSRDGRLLSNEGELRVGTGKGVRYTLRFGEVIFGEGLEVTAGKDGEQAAEPDDEEEKPTTGAENRYLFVTAALDESLLGDKPVPPEKDEAETPSSAQPSPAAAGTSTNGPESEQPAQPAGEAGESAGADAADEAPEATTQPSSGDPRAEQGQADEQAGKALEEYEKALKEWEEKVEEGRKLAKERNDRFAPWYYVISGADFKNIRLDRQKLIKTEEDSD